MSDDQSQAGAPRPTEGEDKKPEEAVPVYVPDPARVAHLNQLHRRGIAVIVDFVLYGLTIGAPLALMVDSLGLGPTYELEEGQSFNPVSYIVVLVLGFSLVRGLFRDASPGQRILGLRVVQLANPAHPADLLQRIGRGISLCLPPGGYMIEYLIAQYDVTHRRRLGDRIAGTKVIDVPGRQRFLRGSLFGAIIAALFLLVVIRTLVTPIIDKLWKFILPLG